jgi:hypothetical protein
MSAQERIAALDDLPAVTLCRRTADCLDDLAHAMNKETTLLREGRFKEASHLTSRKIELAQDYVAFVRAVQRQSARLIKEAPDEVKHLRSGHEKLATQMAENLRVIATARTVTEGLLQDVARTAGAGERSRAYGASGEVDAAPPPAARGIAINRAL